LVPLVIIFLGLTLSARVFIVIMFALPPVAFNTRAGIQGVDPTLIEMARSCSARRWFLWRTVLLPAALPGVLAGVWVAIGRAISGMIIAELTIVAAGLGGLMRDFVDSFNAAGLFAVTLLLVFEGLVLTYGARAIAQSLTPHREERL